MEAYVLVHLSGLYVIDNKGNLLEYRPLEFSVDEAYQIKKGVAPEKLKKEIEKIKNKYDNLRILGRAYSGLDLSLSLDYKLIRKALSYVERYVEDWEKIQELQYQVTVRELSESVTHDWLIIQAIKALDDTNKILNLMIERFREWFELYFPELSKRFEDHEKFIKAVLEKSKEEWMRELKLERSMGGNIDERSVEMLYSFAKRIKDMYEFRRELQEYIKEMMEKYAPNVTAIAGPLVGARLIALAGGLKELAFLPASTIQVLGAEKALFKHLTRKTPPPKHGVLFNHPYVQKLPRKLRGRMARTLAAKIAIAAKVDAFGKYFIGDKLKKEIDKRFEELKKEWEQRNK